MRVFRYVNVLGAPSGLGVDDFPAMAYVYPYDPDAGVFASSDSDLNKVWQLNKNTIESTNGNLYVDSWERERGAYEADSYLQMMANFYTSADPTLGNYSIAYLFRQRTWPTEWPMYIVLAMHDSYAQTGDIDALETYYTALQGKLPEQWFEASTGLIRKTSGSNGANSCTDCDIVDWPSSERDGFVFSQYNTVINAISYRAYADMVDIATALGRTADAATYQARADAIKRAVNQRMWDPAKGAYRDGLSATLVPTDHWAVQASVFATAFGLADDAQAAEVASYLGTRGMVCSVYCSAFLFEALYNGDRADIAYTLLKSTGTRSYLNMIAKGAGATAEAWDKSLKGNLTYSHPWAASIAYNMPQGLFGIKPTTAGYATFDVKPQPDSLDWAHVTVPTLKGRIGAAFDRSGSASAGDERVDVGVHVPANTRARVFVPGAAADVTEVYVDGRVRAATFDGGYARVDGVAPGCHVVSLVPGPAAGLDERLTAICPDGYVAPGLEPVANRTPPSVTGTPSVGATLTADPGTWEPGGATYAYQWQVNGVDVAGATGRTFVPTSAHDGRLLGVRVTATRPGAAPGTASSGLVRVVDEPLRNVVAPSISGTPTVGSTLRLDPGTWNRDGLTLTYLWLVDGAVIRGASKATLTVSASYVGRRLTGRVTATRPGSDSVAAATSNHVVPTTGGTP